MFNLISCHIFTISELNDEEIGQRFDALEARQAKQEEDDHYQPPDGRGSPECFFCNLIERQVVNDF